jgi:hypothetical protein
MISCWSFNCRYISNCFLNVSDFLQSPVKTSGSSPLGLSVRGAAMGAGCGATRTTGNAGATRTTGSAGATGATSGGGGGTLTPASTACSISCWYAGSSGVRGFSGSLSWTSSPCWSCASRTGSSWCSCSGNGSSPPVTVEGCELLELFSSGVSCHAVTNGEMDGCCDKGDRPCVSTDKVGAAEVDGSAKSSNRL